MATTCLSQKQLDEIFSPAITDDFFEALYGGAEDGAYDIALCCEEISSNHANFNFELRKRPGKCLKCSLTYGLPEVFKRHPIINLKKVTSELAEALGWTNYEWELKPVREINDNLHLIPLQIDKISS